MKLQTPLITFFLTASFAHTDVIKEKIKKIILLFALLASTFISFSQTKAPAKKSSTTTKPTASKFGALAIDRSNGFYYGWSFDYSTLVDAERKAIDECNKRGGNCTVVLSYSGTGCAAYRTVDGDVGTAFGWGVAETKEEADAIATQESLKRSSGKSVSNFVWSCNSKNSGKLREIYNASSEIFASVKIGTQEWTTENLNVVKFQNGDNIPHAKSKEEWMQYCKDKKPAFYDLCNLPGQQACGKMYNIYAVTDQRGLSPKGWVIPTVNDWNILFDYLGGLKKAGTKLANINWGFKNYKGDNSSGFNAKPCDWTRGDMIPTYEYGERGSWWTSTLNPSMSPESLFSFRIALGDASFNCKLDENGYYYAMYVRCLKK